jgi:hypothetical protein
MNFVRGVKACSSKERKQQGRISGPRLLRDNSLLCTLRSSESALHRSDIAFHPTAWRSISSKTRSESRHQWESTSSLRISMSFLLNSRSEDRATDRTQAVGQSRVSCGGRIRQRAQVHRAGGRVRRSPFGVRFQSHPFRKPGEKDGTRTGNSHRGMAKFPDP